MDFLELYWTDVYKTGHKFMLPPGSTLMYSNFTPRSGKLANFPNAEHIAAVGMQMMVRKMKHDWDVNFFQRPIEEIDQFGADMKAMLILEEDFDVQHFKDLHALGYLPIRIKAIEEGTLIPYKIPLFTIVNTKPLNNMIVDWLVNYLETMFSAESWQCPTSATLAYQYRQLGKTYALKTDPESMWFVDYQFHDFSMRGQSGKSAIVNSGLGFAMCSKGSDTLPVIPAARKYYDEVDVCINSVLATEHAIMCTLTGFFIQEANGDWTNIGKFELETFRWLLKRFPTGILSLVSDTWDLWRTIIDYCRELKDEIMARNGKLVIRPDSGDPVDIICGLDIKQYDSLDKAKSYFKDDLYSNTVHGEADFTINTTCIVKVKDKYYELTEETNWNRYDKQYYYIENISINSKEIEESPIFKGVIELLWEIFGGTTTSTDYKKLDSHIGAIYGDSITIARAQQIFERLEAKGFASTNIVLGVGSYSLQYVTRDTHGFAQKATYVEVNGIGIAIFKDPITDNGVKKSAKGLLRVDRNEAGKLVLTDNCTWEQEAGGLLQVIFEDGKFYNQTTLTKIRQKLF